MTLKKDTSATEPQGETPVEPVAKPQVEPQVTPPVAPPVAPVIKSEKTVHGQTVADDYAWLRADNWQEVMRDPSVLDARIRDYLESENAFLGSIMSDTEKLQGELKDEMKGRIKEDDSSVPAPDGPWSYYTSFVTGGEYPRICRRPRDGGAEQILLDGNAMSEGHSYFSLAGATHSSDHRYIAYALDLNGSEFYTIRIHDTETGEDLDDVIENANPGAVWAADNHTLYYTRLDENHRPRQVYRHKLGSTADEDALVYDEKDPGFFVGLGATQSRKYILIGAHDHQTSEVYLIDAEASKPEPICVEPRETGHEYSVEHNGERLLIMTNTDGAEDFKIVETPVEAPGRANWRDIDPHRPGRLILSITAFADYLVRLERENSLPRIVVRRLSDGDEHEISFDEEAYSLGLSSGYEYDTPNVRFTYSSMTTPTQVFDYHMDKRERELRKVQEVPSGHDPADYVTRRMMAPTPDGESVPVSLVYHRNTPIDGSAPVLLYGYGSYGISIPASFSTNRLSLVDRGFIYAIAHVRGGKEKGYHWYTEGRREKKTNTFNDFISAANHLIAQGMTRKGNIVAHGGSAGGMLMGAIANMAPDLWNGIIAEVPFVDVLNTMLDDTLPLTPPEWPEWGNPIESREAFDWIGAYSPYDNVAKKDYPHILALAGLTDPRVTYWEPAKWIAKLRATRTDNRLTLFRTNMGAGHGGASGRFDRLNEVALSYAFALKISNRAA